MTTTLITHTPEHLIGECAKICYATKSIDEGGKDITSQLVHGHGHLAALRFAFAVVKVDNISVACQNQIVRSKHLDFMVQSKRYVNPQKGEFEFIYPEYLTQQQEDVMHTQWEAAILAYDTLIANGCKKEDARAILPMNTSTKMFISGNLQAYMDFFKLRLSPRAQAEINAVALSIYVLLRKEYPQVFTAALYEKLSK